MATNATVILPINSTYYGEIGEGELDKFLNEARAALKMMKFSQVEVLNTDGPQELWEKGTSLEGGTKLDIKWAQLVGTSEGQILEAIAIALDGSS